ncbi:MAG: tetratricopeptide repeat protein, partial [Pirellulales bacterium]|nr:tetratricopeptide repeat protein [Pirellulales bacterium]
NALQTENPEILFSRGIALSALGKTEQAIDDFTQVVLLAPHFVPVFHRRGANYEKLGKFDRAEEDFNQAITLNPKDAQGYNNLAWLQATCFDPAFRDGKKALANAKKAMTLFSNDNFFVLDTMAAAYAEAGQYKKAVEWQLKAIEQAPENAKEPLTERLERYQAGKPYRAPTGL